MIKKNVMFNLARRLRGDSIIFIKKIFFLNCVLTWEVAKFIQN